MAKQASKKKCPPYPFFFIPTLKALEELNGSGSNEEIYKKVVSLINLPADVLNEMHDFTKTEVEYRIAWAKTYLKKYGALDNKKSRIWSLTAKGLKMLKNGNIDEDEIVKFVNNTRNTSTTAEVDIVTSTLNDVKDTIGLVYILTNPALSFKLIK